MTNSTYAKNNGDLLRYSILWRCSVPFRASDCGWRKGVSKITLPMNLLDQSFLKQYKTLVVCILSDLNILGFASYLYI